MSETRIIRGLTWGLGALSMLAAMAAPVGAQEIGDEFEPFGDLAKQAKQEAQLLAQEQKAAAPGQTAAEAKVIKEVPASEKKASVDLNKVQEGGIIVSKGEKAKPVPAKAETVEAPAIQKQEAPGATLQESAAAREPEAKAASLVVGNPENPAVSAPEKPAPAPQVESANNDLKNQVELLQRRAAALSRELDETRNRLIIAETEVERLSSVLAERNRASLAKYSPGSARPAHPAPAARVSSPAPAVSVPRAQQEKMTEDMLIATVVSEKAHLRTGPGKDNSPLMTVSKGTRLAIETRNGDWYRVISPTGARAWVSSDCLAFGQSRTSSPSKTVKVRGYESSAEDEASRFIRDELR